MYDIIIENALVFDGSQNPPYIGNIGIKDGKIAPAPMAGAEAKERIDASGSAVSPGWIDAHGHTDLFAFADPDCSAKLLQGVTTELAGQCGYTAAPVSEEFWDVHKGYYQSLGAPLYPGNRQFTSMDALFGFLEQLPLGINLASFIGHGTLRMAAMGLSGEKPDAAQMDAMKRLLREAMEAGAMGLSTGLMYAPGSFSDTEELKELCKVVAEYNGIYTSHMRNQGGELFSSVKEVIGLAKATGVQANISHFKAAGRSNWGKVKEAFAMIDEAVSQGCRITADVYPYAASSTNLSATLPPSYMKLGVETLLDRLASPAFAAGLEQDIFHPSEAFDNDLLESGYDGILILSSPQTPEAAGLTIAQYAVRMGIRPFDAYVKLLVENRLTVSDICFSMDEEDVCHVLVQPGCMIGTDSLYIPGMKMVHPRSIGTFPRVLARYVREKRVLSMEDAIYKMTGLAAKTYGLAGKGSLAEGMDADLVLFDPERIGDHAQYLHPLEKNEGIRYVIVNGIIAAKDGAVVKPGAGRVLRR